VNRRQMMKFLGLAPVAAEKAAAMALKPGNEHGWIKAVPPMRPAEVTRAVKENEHRLGHLKRQIEELRGPLKARELREIVVTRLDPDLAYAKSFSMAARIRMQTERVALEQRRVQLESYLQDLGIMERFIARHCLGEPDKKVRQDEW
jgi:hypothetical protein